MIRHLRACAARPCRVSGRVVNRRLLSSGASIPEACTAKPILGRSGVLASIPEVCTKPFVGRGVLAVIAAGTTVGATATLCDDAKKSDNTVRPVNRLTAEVRKLNLNRAIDSNGDGEISKEELDKMFDKLDVNKDGQITYDEWKEYLVSSGLSPDKCAALELLFKELDTDGSGSIDRAEFEQQFHADYAARYARGAVVAFLTKGRFIAYTSDIGESTRPVMPSWFVNGAYALTFVYVAVAVGHHTQTAYEGGASNIMVARSFVHTATFELIASVALPSLIIHQAVHFAQHQAHRLPKGRIAMWAPTVVGLCCIPFLPFLDPPAEKVIDAAFDYAWPDDGTLPPKLHH